MAEGRPKKYTDELALIILTEIATTHKSLKKICSENSLAVSTLLIWLRDDKEFSLQYARAKEAQADLFADEIIEIADESLNAIKVKKKIVEGEEVEREVITGDNVERAKLMIDARKWSAAHLRPKKYGNHKAPDNNDTPPISFEDFVKKIDNA